MTHVLRYLLIHGERKKKVEVGVDQSLQSVELDVLKGRAREMFNLSAVILQIWDKDFDDWVDLEDGDPIPTNSRIKVEADKTTPAVATNKTYTPTLLQKVSHTQETPVPDVIHIVDSPTDQAPHIPSMHHVATTQVPTRQVQAGMVVGSPGASSTSRSMHHMERVTTSSGFAHQRQTTPSSVVRDNASRAARDVVYASGATDFDKRASSSGASHTHTKAASSQQHLYQASLQSSSDAGAGAFHHGGYSAGKLVSEQGLQQETWSHLPVYREGSGEETRLSSSDARLCAMEKGQQIHSTFRRGELSHQRALPTTSYLQETSSGQEQLLAVAEKDAGRLDNPEDSVKVDIESSSGRGDFGSNSGRGQEEFLMPLDPYRSNPGWFYQYELPEFPKDIVKKLRIGLELTCTEQRSMMAAIYDSVIKYTFYPTTNEYNLLTDKLMDEFPVLQNQTSLKGNESAWESFKQKLMYKFKNQRKRRDAKIPEVLMRKRLRPGRPTLLNVGTMYTKYGDDDGFEIIDDVDPDAHLEIVEIKAEEDDAAESEDSQQQNRFHVMAADTTETGSQSSGS